LDKEMWGVARNGTHASGLGSDDGDERGDEGEESEAHLVGVVF
jgi:hypothetical protein